MEGGLLGPMLFKDSPCLHPLESPPHFLNMCSADNPQPLRPYNSLGHTRLHSPTKYGRKELLR
ncbi:hypothetical protein J6590_040189 [Homalodisca vitripennis]|nr:hypothetical protein J6590_040189 [Homalodisca vitripennis]